MTSSLSDARLETAGEIKYKLIEGPTFSGDAEGLKAMEKYLIAASDVAAFYNESFPPPIVFNQQLVFPPKRRMPGTTVLVTKSVNFEPQTNEIPSDPFSADPSAPAGTYNNRYVATINYETMQEEEENEPDPDKPETFLEHSVDVGGEFLHWSPKKKLLKDPEDSESSAVANTDQQLSAVKVIPTIEHTLKWSRVIKPPWSVIRQLLGRVNNNELKIFNNAKVETVMFMGVSGTQKYLFDGVQGIRLDAWTLDFKFSEKSVTEHLNPIITIIAPELEPFYYGWNHVFVPSKNKWMELQDENGLPLHKLADFSELFKNEPQG